MQLEQFLFDGKRAAINNLMRHKGEQELNNSITTGVRA